MCVYTHTYTHTYRREIQGLSPGLFQSLEAKWWGISQQDSKDIDSEVKGKS